MLRLLAGTAALSLIAGTAALAQDRGDETQTRRDARSVNYTEERSSDGSSAASRSREYLRAAQRLARGNDTSDDATTEETEEGNAPLQVDDDVILPAQRSSGPDRS